MENKLKHGVSSIREALNIDESSIKFNDVFLSNSPREKEGNYVSYIVFTDKLNIFRDLLDELDIYVCDSSIESTNGELTEVVINYMHNRSFEYLYDRVIAPYMVVKQKNSRLVEFSKLPAS